MAPIVNFVGFNVHLQFLIIFGPSQNFSLLLGSGHIQARGGIYCNFITDSDSERVSQPTGGRHPVRAPDFPNHTSSQIESLLHAFSLH